MEAAAEQGDLSEELRGAGAPGSERANRIALEVCVNATGARPSTGTEKRELFSEDTKTALVFPDAAVIQLNAAVVPGQLVFLTNKENNREVVCQVIRKRNNRPTSCYVELQFTEAQTDFWGVAFPERPAAAAEAQTTPMEESVVSAEETEEPAAAPVAAPSSEEMETLRQEVDALREQLKALTEERKREEEEAKKAEEEAARKAQEEADAAIAALAAKRAAAKPLIRMSLPAAPLGGETSGSAQEKPVGAGAPTLSTIAPQGVPGAMTKPPAIAEKAGHSEEREAFEDLLPEPALDFSHAPIPVKRPDDDDPYSIYKPLRRKVGMKDVVVAVMATVLLVGGVGFAWYKDKLPMARRKSGSPAANLRSTPATKPAASAPVKSAGESVGGAPNAGAPGTTATPETVSQPTTGGGEAGGPAPERSGESNTAATTEETSKLEPTREAPATTKKAVRTKKSAAAGPTKKRGATAAAAVTVPPEPEPAADGPLEAAKLVRAARPVYPPDAMRNFITGDVRIDAEVGADGRVGKVAVISGPTALREAAVEAMKQYEYEAATRGGKAVASHVRVTIKFWFDP